MSCRLVPYRELIPSSSQAYCARLSSSLSTRTRSAPVIDLSDCASVSSLSASWLLATDVLTVVSGTDLSDCASVSSLSASWLLGTDVLTVVSGEVLMVSISGWRQVTVSRVRCAPAESFDTCDMQACGCGCSDCSCGLFPCSCSGFDSCVMWKMRGFCASSVNSIVPVK